MRFIPRDRNMEDIPYGENGHYSTSIDKIHIYYEIRIVIIHIIITLIIIIKWLHRYIIPSFKIPIIIAVAIIIINIMYW